MLTDKSPKKIPLLSLLTPSERKLIRQEEFTRGQIIARENDECMEVGFVIEGEIVISSYTYHGEEVVYNMLSDNDMFGNNLLLSSDPHYRGNIIAT
ncbi:MAG: cyclic nucleotide-binding domain-containing protein, partial [Bacilli bacterium]|nr:cyclic nucleotide-binding domain-containing protein [Bacilli bacterium]